VVVRAKEENEDVEETWK